MLARELGELTGLPVHELDSLFWQPDGGAASPGRWEAHQRALVTADAWILDGDLGPYDYALAARLRAADTIIVLDFPFLHCAWRTARRGRERAEYWRWVWAYRRRWLPRLLQAIAGAAPQAELHVLRSPGAVRRFTAGLQAGRGGC